MGFNPNRKKMIPENIAKVIAIEQYFFWVFLICSILVVFVFKGFHNLSVNHNPSADDTEDGEDSYKESF